MKNLTDIQFVFFGTDDFAVTVLKTLKEVGCTPTLIVTTEDTPQGRNRLLTAPKVKKWAMYEKITCIQPTTLTAKDVVQTLTDTASDVFVVASYGKIISNKILSIPAHKCLNIHPSLLPEFRGASPLQTAILKAETTGVTIMEMDQKMDHGPIVAQEEAKVPEWPLEISRLRTILASQGAFLLAHILPSWIAGTAPSIPQNHSNATFTKKITKDDGLLNLTDPAGLNIRKIYAFQEWPKPYFFVEKNSKEIRIVVKEAHIENGTLYIDRVIPEGKKEMSYADFLRGFKNDSTKK